MDPTQEEVQEKNNQVQVRFVTKLDLQLPESSFSVPDNLARYGLSEIVNHLIGAGLTRAIRCLDSKKSIKTNMAMI